MYKEFEKFNMPQKIKKKLVYEEPHTIYDYSKDYIDKVANRTSKELGFNYLKFIGMGDYGMAYDVNGNKVLKITTDENEYKIANYLRGKNTKYLIEIYDVRKISDDKTNSALYSIVMDKVEKLNITEKEFITALNSYFFYESKLDIYQFMNLYDTDEKLYKFMSDNWVFNRFLTNFGGMINILHDIFHIKLEAKKYGIECRDLRSDNVGWKNDKMGRHLVFFDIGSYAEKNFKTTRKKLKDINIK